MTDLLHALLALAVLMMPMGFAWFVLSRTARRHSRKKSDVASDTPPLPHARHHTPGP